jgi:hypothetical protein
MFLVFIMPIGIGNIGWKMYMINGGWDIITFVLIVSACACFWGGKEDGYCDRAKLTLAGCILGRDQGQEFGGN